MTPVSITKDKTTAVIVFRYIYPPGLMSPRIAGDYRPGVLIKLSDSSPEARRERCNFIRLVISGAECVFDLLVRQLQQEIRQPPSMLDIYSPHQIGAGSVVIKIEHVTVH